VRSAFPAFLLLAPASSISAQVVADSSYRFKSPKAACESGSGPMVYFSRNGYFGREFCRYGILSVIKGRAVAYTGYKGCGGNPASNKRARRRIGIASSLPNGRMASRCSHSTWPGTGCDPRRGWHVHRTIGLTELDSGRDEFFFCSAKCPVLS
jgi:hypothetical protein